MMAIVINFFRVFVLGAVETMQSAAMRLILIASFYFCDFFSGNFYNSIRISRHYLTFFGFVTSIFLDRADMFSTDRRFISMAGDNTNHLTGLVTSLSVLNCPYNFTGVINYGAVSLKTRMHSSVLRRHFSLLGFFLG